MEHLMLLQNSTKIKRVEYQMEQLMIYDETPFLAGTKTLTNTKDEEDLMDVCINYVDEKSHTFNRLTWEDVNKKDSFMITDAALPFIDATENGRTISFLNNRKCHRFEWGTAFTTTTPVTASGRVLVPARSTAVVDYVGTRGTCRLLFDYERIGLYIAVSGPDRGTRRSMRLQSSNWRDGSYQAVSCYDFEFRIRSVQPLNAMPELG